MSQLSWQGGNGRESRLYDTLSKNLVADTTIVSREFTITLPEEDRIEALQLFLGSSPANVLRLSAAQIESETATLKGSPTDLGAVYIQAAHRRNTALLASVRRFLRSTSSLFVTVGEAGSGKTCAAVDIATRLLPKVTPRFSTRVACLSPTYLKLCGAKSRGRSTNSLTDFGRSATFRIKVQESPS